MNILCSVTYFDPYVSGLSIYAKRLAEGLAIKGDRVTVLTMSGKARLRLARQGEVIVAKPFIKIHKGFLSFDWIVKSWQQVRSHDVLIVHLPQAEGWIPALFARLLGKRVVSIYHCEVVLPNGLFNTIIQIILEIANTVTLLFSHVVVTYTKDYADHSRLLRLVKHKIIAIYPPIPIPKVSKSLVLKYKKQIGKCDVVIGVAARLAAEKGIEYLIHALPILQKKLPKQILKIVLAVSMNPVGEEAYKIKIMQLVKKYKKQVVFLGEIAPDQMGSFYECIDVLVVPSINSTEAFGLVQVEAMMTGVPVVASDLPGVRTPIQKTGMGIVVPIRNSKKLAEALEQIVRHPKNFFKMQKDVLKEFSYDKSIENLHAIISL
ncbi:MAG: glycosyltransferase family 4 protein [Patescibacteria group bacterium]